MIVISVKKEDLNRAGYRNFNHWNQDPRHLYIGRDMTFYVEGTVCSKWKPPFSVKKYSTKQALKKYKLYLCETGLLYDMHELENITELGCWCSGGMCHGHLLKQLFENQ